MIEFRNEEMLPYLLPTNKINKSLSSISSHMEMDFIYFFSPLFVRFMNARAICPDHLNRRKVINEMSTHLGCLLDFFVPSLVHNSQKCCIFLAFSEIECCCCCWEYLVLRNWWRNCVCKMCVEKKRRKIPILMWSQTKWDGYKWTNHWKCMIQRF